MDSDHEDEQELEEDGGGSSQDSALTGFLFGNIDKKGKLENDVLDEVRHTKKIVCLWLLMHTEMISKLSMDFTHYFI